MGDDDVYIIEGYESMSNGFPRFFRTKWFVDPTNNEEVVKDIELEYA